MKRTLFLWTDSVLFTSHTSLTHSPSYFITERKCHLSWIFQQWNLLWPDIRVCYVIDVTVYGYGDAIYVMPSDTPRLEEHDQLTIFEGTNSVYLGALLKKKKKRSKLIMVI